MLFSIFNLIVISTLIENNAPGNEENKIVMKMSVVAIGFYWLCIIASHVFVSIMHSNMQI